MRSSKLHESIEHILRKTFYKEIIELDTIVARNKHIFPNMDEGEMLIILIDCELI